MRTLELTDEELEDLLGAIEVSLCEGQEGTRIACALRRNGVELMGDAKAQADLYGPGAPTPGERRWCNCGPERQQIVTLACGTICERCGRAA